MRNFNRIRRVALSLTLLSFCWQSGAQSIEINPSDIKQYVDMMGGDMERSASAIQSAINKQEIIEWSFKDINFNVCRVQYDKNQELTEGVKNWDFYSEQVATMKAIKAVNPDIKFFATLRSDYDGYGDENNLPDWIINYNTKVMEREKYGIFLADYLEYMHNQGVTISIISSAKEWMWFVRAEKARDVINKMNSELDVRGVPRPIISDQGFWSLSAGITYLKDVEFLGTKDLYHSFCSHNYGNESQEKWVEITELAKALGKPIYDDETSTGSGSPTYGEERAIAKQIGEYIKKANRYEAGISGEVFFEIWSRGIDKETRSIYFPAKGTGTRKRGYFLMKYFSNQVLYSNYIPTSITNLSNVYTMTFRKENQIIHWVINKSTTNYPSVRLTLSNAEFADSVQIHRWTDNVPVEGVSATFQTNADVFETSLPGESITCYTFSLKDYSENESLSGVATQSSTDGNANASLAIDGNKDGALANGSVSKTLEEADPWWKLDLGSNDTIGAVQIFNRTDACCASELANFTLSIANENSEFTFSKVVESIPNDSLLVMCGGAIGRYVSIQIEGAKSLTLAEVEVFKGSVVEKQDQTITFPTLGTVSYSLTPINPSASASSGLAVTYTSSNTDVARIENGTIVLYGVGTTVITASREASTSFNAAADVSQTLTVEKGEQTIVFDVLPADTKVGDPSILLKATASSGEDVVFSSSNEAVAIVEGDRVKIIAQGIAIIKATAGANSLYNAVGKTQVLLVRAGDSNTDNTKYTLTPTDDAYVRGGSYSGNNYGSEADLLIKQTSNGDFYRKSLLQFDVFDVIDIESATLRMYANSAKASTITIYATTDNWDESSVTYSSAPAKGTTLGAKAVNAGGSYYEWDLTSYVTSQMEGDNIVSLVVEDASSNKNNIIFNSKEASDNKPQLVIDRGITNTAVEDISTSNSSFNLYPNPASDNIWIESHNAISFIKIYNIAGKLVYEKHKPFNKDVISINNFEEGLYILQVQFRNGNITSLKVEVQH